MRQLFLIDIFSLSINESVSFLLFFNNFIHDLHQKVLILSSFKSLKVLKKKSNSLFLKRLIIIEKQNIMYLIQLLNCMLTKQNISCFIRQIRDKIICLITF